MIIRVGKRRRYLTMDKAGLEDARLSFKAKGLLAFLLSKPDDWTINYRDLVNVGPDGRTAILTGLAELADTGYLHRERHNTHDGFRWDQVLYEQPPHAQETGASAHAQETDTNYKNPTRSKPAHSHAQEIEPGPMRRKSTQPHAPVSHALKTGTLTEEGSTEEPPLPPTSGGRNKALRANGTNPRAQAQRRQLEDRIQVLRDRLAGCDQGCTDTRMCTRCARTKAEISIVQKDLDELGSTAVSA